MTRTAPYFIAPALIALAFLSSSGCDVGSCGGCTNEFRSYVVQVVDISGDPIEGLNSTVFNNRTGRSIVRDSTNDQVGFGGIYPLLSDSEIEFVSEDGDTISFRATGNGVIAEATFVMGTSMCRCHILKISGPETITAS